MSLFINNNIINNIIMEQEKSNINHNIFITQTECNENNNNIDNKLSKTLILDNIPENHLDKAIDNWELNTKYKSEWRWRFLEFKNILNNKQSVEISYKLKHKPRLYCTKTNEWVIRDVPEVYDQFVVKNYYCYVE